MKTIPLLIVVFSACCVMAQTANCRECGFSQQFHEPICIFKQAGCGCDCFIDNKPPVPPVCILCGDCFANECRRFCDLPVTAATTKAVLAAHLWAADTSPSTVESIRQLSDQMASTFISLQDMVRVKHWTNARGVSRPNDDKSTWISFELISRSDGTDEIRLTHVQSGIRERLIFAESKWFLLRAEPNADHEMHEVPLGDGSLNVESK